MLLRSRIRVKTGGRPFSGRYSQASFLWFSFIPSCPKLMVTSRHMWVCLCIQTLNIIKDKRRSYMENLLMTTNRAPLLTHGQTGIRNRLVFFFRGVQECFQSVFRVFLLFSECSASICCLYGFFKDNRLSNLYRHSQKDRVLKNLKTLLVWRFKKITESNQTF